jgi:hypothetical protein
LDCHRGVWNKPILLRATNALFFFVSFVLFVFFEFRFLLGALGALRALGDSHLLA